MRGHASGRSLRRRHPVVGAYEDTVAWLQALEARRGWDLKLERMRAACELLGDPQRRFRVLHIAGTNGKGSTAAFTEAILRAAGVRTGLYTSPHLVDFTERIRAGGCTIPQESVVTVVRELRHVLEPAGLALTHFEMATLIAFVWFARIGVEVAVVEVGLGGRLDATNVVEPLACAVTSIARDHEAWLGSTEREIAGEKAGIVKAGVPVVTGYLGAEAAAVVAERAAAVGARVLRAGVDFVLAHAADGLVFQGIPGCAWGRLRLGLRGALQERNAEVALGLLATARDAWPCGETAVRSGLAGTVWPGRLAVVRECPQVVLDGAHNLAGVEALKSELPALVGERPLTLVLAVMADKPVAGIAARLGSGAVRAVVTRVGARSADPALLAAALPSHCRVEIEPEPQRAVRRAVDATPAHGAVLVAGSLFLVGEAYVALGGPSVRLFEPWNGWERLGRGAQP